MSSIPLHFIDELIQVFLPQDHLLAKTPECPVGFEWRGENFVIVSCLQEWNEFERKGKTARNMSPEHALHAAQRGSWGVGRYYYRVKVQSDRIFEIYYDRSPGHAGDRKGRWFLLGERKMI
jgi:hypothetical protein